MAPQQEGDMAHETLTRRVEVLERQLADLTARVLALDAQPDWRSAIGMFGGDEFMRKIFDEGRKIREADRRQAKSARKRK